MQVQYTRSGPDLKAIDGESTTSAAKKFEQHGPALNRDQHARLKGFAQVRWAS